MAAEALDFPIEEEDSTSREQDTIQDVRIDWALAIEDHLHISLHSKKEKEEAITGRWVASDSTDPEKLLNEPKPGHSNASTNANKRDICGKPNAKQTVINRPITSNRPIAPAPVTPVDSRNTGPAPPLDRDPRRPSCGMQQSREISYTSPYHQQMTSPAHHLSPPSPSDSVYEIARRAVSVLGSNQTQISGPVANDARHAVSNTQRVEQTAPREYTPLQAPPTSHSHAQTSLSNYHSGQAPPTSPRTVDQPPTNWKFVQTYPGSQKATVTKTSSRPVTNIQQQRPQPSWMKRPKSAAARRRAMLKHSITYTLPAASPQTSTAPGQPAYPQPGYPQSRYAQPVYAEPRHSLAATQPSGASQRTSSLHASYPQNHLHGLDAPQSAKTSIQATPPQPMTTVLAFRPAASPYPRLMPRPTAAPQESRASQLAALYPQPPQQATRDDGSVEGPRERKRRLKREALLKIKQYRPRQDLSSLHDPQESSILGMLPSVGNRVVEHLIKHNPSAIAASKLCHAIPEQTAVHYSSILTWHAQNVETVEEPFPHDYPPRRDDVESRPASSHEGSASREAQNMEPAIVQDGSMPVSQQMPNTENPPRLDHSSTLAHQDDAQWITYSRGSSVEPNNASNEYANYSSAPNQQIVNGQRARTPITNSYGDVQEVSRMDWQTANRENLAHQNDIQVAAQQDWQAASREGSRPPIDQSLQPVVISAPQEAAVIPSVSASFVNPQSVSEPYSNRSTNDMLSMRVQRPIRPKPAPAQVQAQEVKQPERQYQASPVFGGVHKRKFSRDRTSLLKTVVSQGLESQAASRRITISQLLQSPTEVPTADRPRTVTPQAASSQVAAPQSRRPQAAIPETASRTPLPSGRQNKQRYVQRSGSGMWLTEDDVERWQEERRNPYCLPSFTASFGDVNMNDHQARPEKQASSEPARGTFSLSAYRINPVPSRTNPWLGIVNN
ncbi:hypothetical protein V8C35DRAFT_153000 [Trichoderma chlorosporum]